MANVFIAPKIKVGFQKRTDTFTGQLAYVIYYDEKGKLRKEKSWESWRDKKIVPQEFENVPTDGFTINKDIKRYSGEWFSSSRTMIRIHDPRGFEFEVTTENLIGILMHTDCLRRGLIGQFVYAWVGPELVLLPTTSEEYQNAAKYTTGLSKKVSAKALVPGVSYKTKREGNVIYIGRLNWYEFGQKGRYSGTPGPRKEEKAHVFTDDEGKTFMKKSGAEFLAEANSEEPVSNFAELMQKFNKTPNANKIARVEFRPTTFNPSRKTDQYNHHRLVKSVYFLPLVSDPNMFVEKHVQVATKWDNDSKEYKITGYSVTDERHDSRGIRQPDGGIVQLPSPNRDRYGYYDFNPPALSEEQVSAMKFYDFVVVFENGKERNGESIYQFIGDEY